MQAKDIIHRASITLQDTGFVRWPLPELLLYLNDGMEAIALHKPNAVTKVVEMPLAPGTLQDLTSIDPSYIALIRVIRNKNGAAITATSRNTLDMVMPGWQDQNVLPRAAVVQHVVQDMAAPRSFYVVPGNDGTGVIEAVVSVLPPTIAEPASPLDINSYTDEVGVPPIYKTALTDYVLYRAYSKDGEDPSNAARSQAHYNLFAQAIGIKIQSEQTANLKTTGATA